MAKCHVRAVLLLLLAALVVVVQPPSSALAWTYQTIQVGGMNWPTTLYGASSKIWTSDPRLNYSTNISCAWVMITRTSNQTQYAFTAEHEWMQFGWDKAGNGAQRLVFVQWWDGDPDFEHFYDQRFGPTSGLNRYTITHVSGGYRFEFNGVNMITATDSDVPWAPGNTYEMMGEVLPNVDADGNLDENGFPSANGYFAGTDDAPCVFQDNQYKNGAGVWYHAYFNRCYLPYYDPTWAYGESSATSNSYNFYISDGRL
jgi:hypothetical protein